MKKINLTIILLILGNICLFAHAPRMANWRWRADDGNEQNATFLKEENTELIITNDENIRLRQEIYASGENDVGGLTNTYSLRYSADKSNWIEINNNSENVFVLSLSDNFSDLENTTSDLLANSNYQVLEYGKMIESSKLINFSAASFEDKSIEFEWCIKPTEHVIQGQRYYFRVVDGDQLGDSPDNYLVPHSDNYPILTVGAPLPVELTTFTATSTNNKVNLSWGTATEVNNYGFEIEKGTSTPLSTNDNKITNTNQIIPSEVEGWEVIGFVNGNGNSNSPKLYSFADDSPSLGKIKYRLKQIDIDGSYEYSKEIEISKSAPSELKLEQNYPNPFNPSTTINYTIVDNGNVQLHVYNTLGEVVKELVNENQNAGKHQVNFNASELSSGIYFYRLISEKNIFIKKMLLIK